MIDKLASALKTGRQADLEAAKYVYLLAQTDAGAAEINAELPKHGISPVSKGYLSKLKSVYEIWIVNRGHNQDDLAGIGISKLYAIREHPELLEAARTTTDDDLNEMAQQSTRDKPLKEPFKSLRLPESVYQQFESALVRLNDITRTKTTMTQFVEFLAEYLTLADSDTVAHTYKEIMDGHR